MSFRPRVDACRIRWQRLSECVLLYNIATDAMYETNETGLEILKLCDGRHTCREAAERIASLYARSLEAVLADVTEFVSALASHQFL